LFAALTVLLLLACANIAGLMVARTSARGHELAVRGALGATRARLLRQVLVESSVLALAGGVIGLAIARGATAFLLHRYPSIALGGVEPRQNIAVLIFAAGTSIAAALVFGVLPAWQLTRVELARVIGSGGRTVSGPAGHTLRTGLVVAEAALALVLMVAAGVCLRSFAQLQRVNPGFDSSGLMTAAYALPQGRRVDPQRAATTARTILDRLHASPAVSTAAIGRPIPFSGEYEGSAFLIEDQPRPAGQPLPQAERRWVTPGYARTLGIRVERGRFFTDDDRAESEPVVVVDAKLAREYFPGQDPVGKRIRPTAAGDGSYTIVGVVSHVAHSSLASDADRGVYYNCFFQRPMLAGFILVKVTNGSTTAAAAIRDAVQTADRNLPAYDLRTMDDRLADSLEPRRAVMQLLALFAAAALLLAALGLYGIVSYMVAQRRREIAIRVALGAARGEVLRLVVGQGVRLAAVGSVLGFAGAMISGKWLESQLFQIRALDPPTIAITMAALLAAAIAASYLPARRALRVDPATSLREG
jgi:predicted permease